MTPLNPREKQVVGGGIFLALVFICIQFIYLPAHDKRQALTRTLATEEKGLERMGLLQAEYRNLAPDNTQDLEAIRTRGQGFTLFSFLDQKAAKAGIKANIDYMKPHTRNLDNRPFTLSIVKLKLKQIVFRDFIRFIQEVESQGRGIWISSLSLTKSGKEKNRLDAVLEAQTLTAKDKGGA